VTTLTNFGASVLGTLELRGPFVEQPVAFDSSNRAHILDVGEIRTVIMNPYQWESRFPRSWYGTGPNPSAIGMAPGKSVASVASTIWPTSNAHIDSFQYTGDGRFYAVD